MNIETFVTILLVVLCLGSAAVNFLHWRGRASERFVYFPTAGILRAANWAWIIASIVSALLFLLNVLPAVAFLAIGISWNVAAEFYSIWYRQAQRRP
jgi:hypothetical protein